MNKIKEIGLTAVIATLAVVVVLYALGILGVKAPLGGATITDLTARFATSSTITVTGSGVVVVAATSSCASRMISTGATSLLLTFDDSIPTATTGFRQTASTTQLYDAKNYGCGGMRAKSEGVGGGNGVAYFMEFR